MAIVRPSNAAHSWDTVNTLSIDNLYSVLIDPHQVAAPTQRILWKHAKRDTLGPDEKFGWPIKTHNYSPAAGRKAQVFDARDIDNIIRSEWQPVLMYSDAGTNDVDMAHWRTDKAFIDHVALKIDAMHEGFTEVLNYLLFSDWSETITTGEINVSSELSNLALPPESLTMRNLAAHSDRCYSIPMIIRDVVTGHTLGNIPVTSTTNLFYHPVITDNSSATVTRNTTSGAAQADVVTTVANAAEIDLDDIRTHLSKQQLGHKYNLYAACPQAIYGHLEDLLLAITRRDIASPLGELGIRAAIEWERYHVVFYEEPMMTALWPDSIFFFDPEGMFMQIDSAFDPANGTGIYAWERVPLSTVQGTAMMMNFQLVCPDRRSVSAMHGYTSS